MNLPLFQRLRRRDEKEIALLQDTVIDMLYRIDPTIVLHGGTAIWRCYNGKRFSSDVDAYLQSKEKANLLKGEVKRFALDYGILVDKIKDTGNLFFMGFSIGDTHVKVELNYIAKNITPVAGRLEKVDGTYTEILTLSPEDFILEKIAAYSDRRFIRDVYDIYLISSYVKYPSKIKKAVVTFVSNTAKPVNENELKAIIYEGPVPSFKNMIDYVRSRLT